MPLAFSIPEDGITSIAQEDDATIARARAMNLALSLGAKQHSSVHVSNPPIVRVRQDPEWDRYLNALRSQGVSDTHLTRVRQVWNGLSRTMPELPFPASGMTADGAVQFAWDRDARHLDLDVREDGTLDWFYVDREGRITDVGEGTFSNGIPNALHSYLAAFFSTPWPPR